MEMIFATQNRNKVKEAQAYLGDGFKLILPSDLGISEEIPETGSTLEENALQKCRYIWNKVHKPVFADDSGLEMNWLNGAPGVHTARYAGEGKDPDKNIDKLLEDLTDAPDRSGQFRTAIAYINSEGKEYVVEGIMKGSITFERIGTEGFGYDPVFAPEGYNGLTFAQLGMDVKCQISHRSRALAGFCKLLSSGIC